MTKPSSESATTWAAQTAASKTGPATAIVAVPTRAMNTVVSPPSLSAEVGVFLAPSLQTSATFDSLPRLSINGRKRQHHRNNPGVLSQFNVSHNKLTGNIPKLPKSLKSLDVSNNQLCGSIPSGLNRFGAKMFEHNKCLCDAPLSPCK
ncbi:Polygalacturonase inhibitor [Bienertia sinuspersici]